MTWNEMNERMNERKKEWMNELPTEWMWKDGKGHDMQLAWSEVKWNEVKWSEVMTG